VLDRVHRIRLVSLACVAAAAAAIAASPQRAAVVKRADAPSPHAIAAVSGGCRTLAAVAGAVDAKLARLVAPTTLVRLARPLRVHPVLGGTHVFPVESAAPVADTFGAGRGDVDWHHGDDLFADRGTPVVAVADGFVFSVGWQRLGGRRLWVRDRAGNEFYYAHLQAYAAGVRDGAAVRAGDVVGYVGTSGDAEDTPPHLHFEIHPASLLGVGYDGAVDPTRYLRAWSHVRGRRIAQPRRSVSPQCSPTVVALARP
jgi:murein DD-endopeptidase MepM/ murein hydrolase activator NlpD